MPRREELEAAIIDALEGRGIPEAIDRQLRLEDRERMRGKDPVAWCVARLDLSGAPGLSVTSFGGGPSIESHVRFDFYEPARLVREQPVAPEVFDPLVRYGNMTTRTVMRPEVRRRSDFTVSTRVAWDYEDECVERLVDWSRSIAPGVKTRKHPEDPT